MIRQISFPTSLEEALEILAGDPGCRVLAGGTDLVVAIKEGVEAPESLVSLSKLDGLKGIAQVSAAVKIGAATTLQAICEDAIIKSKYTALAEAAGQVGSWQVRNLATVGGNLCSAVPSADTAPPLLAFNARVRLVGRAGERVLPLEEFFRGPKETVLGRAELLAEILLPYMPGGTGSCYLKLGPRAAMDIAVVGVAAAVTIEDGVCRSAGLALGAVAPTPLKVREAEEALTGSGLTEEDMARAAALAAQTCRPISDHRASADYRRKMVAVLARRALRLARERVLNTREGSTILCS